MSELVNLSAPRAQEARLSQVISPTSYRALLAIGTAFILGAVAAAFTHHRHVAILLVSPALVCYLPAIWWKRQLSVLPP